MTIIHFNTIPSALKEVGNSEYPNEIIKEGLIFYSTEEGKPHIDSRKNKHNFSPEKILELVENTNKHFNISDCGIPVLTEHKKDINNVVGFIESPMEARVIDETYTKGNPKLKHLLGRVGVFVKDVCIKVPEIVDKMRRGLAKTVSAGIDLDSFSIKELSLVALPAIPNATLFSYHANKEAKKPNMKKIKNKNLLVSKGYSKESNYALSLEEALNTSQSIEEQREEAMKVFTAFLEVVEDANEIDPEEMASMGIQDPSELIQGAIEDLSNMLAEMFVSVPEPETQQPAPVTPQRPGMPAKPARYSFSPELIAFAANPYAKSGRMAATVQSKINDMATGKGAAGVYSKIGKAIKTVKSNPLKTGAALLVANQVRKTGMKALSNRKKKSQSLEGKLSRAIKTFKN